MRKVFYNHPPLKIYFRGGRGQVKKYIYRSPRIWFPRTPLNTLFDRWVYVKCRIHGSGYPTPPGSFILGGGLIHFTGLVFPGSPGMFNFFLGIPFFEKCILRGLGSRKAHHFWKMEGINLAKVVIGTPCNAYISKYLRSSIFQHPPWNFLYRIGNVRSWKMVHFNPLT